MKESAELILHGDTRQCSPWVLIVWVALHEKGLKFRYQPLDLETREHDGDYRAHTLAGKVPSLQHGQLWISESLAIVEYLEEAFGSQAPKLLPATAGERARDREILSWLRSDLFELRRCLPYEGVFLPFSPPELTAKAKAEAAALVEVASRHLAAGRATEAATPTLADFELAFTLRRLIHYRVEIGGRPDLHRWSDSLWERPSVRAWVTADRRRFGAAR